LTSNAIKLQQNINDYNTREEIMLACKLAHDHSCGLGKQADWASHTIAHILYRYYHKPHGELVGIIMLSWLDYTMQQNSYKKKDYENLFEEFDGFDGFLRIIGFPTTLKDIGINLDINVIEEICNICAYRYPSGTIGNYIRLNRLDIKNILRIANG